MSELAPSWLDRVRTWPGQVVAYAWDNPTAEHDARGILASPKVGTWLGLEVLLLCLGALIAFAVIPASESAFHQAMVKAGTGQYLISASLITLAAFVTLVVPLRTAGLLEGPRWRGYLDQVVTTGITPMRYFAGKWAMSQAFFLALILASLPMTALYGLLGGATVGRTLAAYLLIYAYCNLLLVITLAIGVVLHELLTVLVVWHLFAFATILDYAPTPSTLAAFTPHRFLIQPFVDALSGSAAGTAMQIYGDPVLLGVQLPWFAYALGLWLAAGLLFSVTLVLGPLHRFLPGTNNFGAVVLPGDAKRLFFRRIRPMLTRRVELAFLFENRGPWLMRWTLPLRSVQLMGGFALASAVLLGLTLHPATIVDMQDFVSLTGLHTGTCALLMLGLIYALASGRSDVSHGFSLASGLRLPLFWFDVGLFFTCAGILAVLHLASVAAAWPDLTLPGLTRWGNIQSAPDFMLRTSLHLAVVIATAFPTFLVTKIVGCRVLNRDVAFLVGVIFLLALVIAPMLFLGAADAFRRADDGGLREYARPLVVFAQASPLMPMVLAEQGWPSDFGPRSHWLLDDAFWFWTSLTTVALLTTALTSNLTSWREARLVEGVATWDGLPCPKCSCAVAAPLGWSWWGGALISRLLGYVRCVECAHEYHQRTGGRSALLVLTALAARVVLSLVIVLALIVWVVGSVEA